MTDGTKAHFSNEATGKQGDGLGLLLARIQEVLSVRLSVRRFDEVATRAACERIDADDHHP
jgi:hypothetical protein